MPRVHQGGFIVELLVRQVIRHTIIIITLTAFAVGSCVGVIAIDKGSSIAGIVSATTVVVCQRLQTGGGGRMRYAAEAFGCRRHWDVGRDEGFGGQFGGRSSGDYTGHVITTNTSRRSLAGATIRY